MELTTATTPLKVIRTVVRRMQRETAVEMLEELLKTCGLNESEQRVFAYLFEAGSAAASVIAKSLAIKRPTVYAALDGLDGRGLTTRSKRSGTTFYALIPTEQIPAVLEARARENFARVQEATARLAPELSARTRRKKLSVGSYEVTVVENIDAIYAYLSEALEGGDFCAVFNPQTACAGAGKAIVEKFLSRTAKSKPKIRELAVSGPDADWYRRTIKNRNHEVKLLPKAIRLSSDIIISDGSVLIAHYTGRRDLGLKIEHTEFAKSLHALFELLWKEL